MTSVLCQANPNMFLIIGLALVIIGSDVICVGALRGRWCSEDKHCDPGEWCRHAFGLPGGPHWPNGEFKTIFKIKSCWFDGLAGTWGSVE